MKEGWPICFKSKFLSLIVSSLAQTDALANLLIEKGLITEAELMEKLSEERLV